MALTLMKVFFLAAHVFASVTANCDAADPGCKVNTPDDAVSLLQMPLQVHLGGEEDDLGGEEDTDDDMAMETAGPGKCSAKCGPKNCKCMSEPICPAQKMNQQNCGLLIGLDPPSEAKQDVRKTGYYSPGDKHYQFMESTASCPACRDAKGHFTYIPAARCFKTSDKADAPDCPGGAKYTTYTDIWKFHPEKHSNAKVEALEEKVATIENFKAMGSKVTDDGKFMFLADDNRDKVAVVCLKTGKVVATFNGLRHPNDIAIWDRNDGQDISLYACAGKGGTKLDMIGKGGAHTGLHIAHVYKKGEWASDTEGTSCKGSDGCKYMKIKGYKMFASKEWHTCAGIGVTKVPEVKGKEMQPNVWASTLTGFAFIDVNDGTDSGMHFDLSDKSWHGNYDCTLPEAFATKGRGFGLVDNVVMVDHNTMITAIYTDCKSNSASKCLVNDAGIVFSGSMWKTANIPYNVLSFTLTCINKVSKADLKEGDLSKASTTYVYPLQPEQCGGPGCPLYNGRITHIQNVGDSLVAINYQNDRIMTFPHSVAQLKEKCA